MLTTFFACQKKEPPKSIAKEIDSSPHDRTIHGVLVKGQVIDDQTRCSHYHTQLDIIALKFKCCNTYYPCYSCHQEKADHSATTWELNERSEKAVLCGVCGNELTIQEYLNSNNTCGKCQSLFNPNCKKHYHLYFKVDSTAAI
jgi:uncharacterized CHY-type Zn-finger protein